MDMLYSVEKLVETLDPRGNFKHLRVKCLLSIGTDRVQVFQRKMESTFIKVTNEHHS